MRSSGAWKRNATSGTSTISRSAQQRDDAKQLAHVDRRPIGGRHQQGAQRFRLALAFERPAQRERAGKGDRDPEDTGRAVLGRLPFLHQREGKHQDARDREEQRRVGDLEAAHLDGQVLSQHEPGGPANITPRRALS